MKKTRNFKIFAAVLALTVALFSITLIGASADDASTSPEIVSTNIEYGGSYGILLAIDADTVSGGFVSVQVWDENGTDRGSFTSTEAETIEALDAEKTYYVVKTPGIAQKDMDKEYTYQATDAAGNKSDVGTISVAEYFYTRLFVNGMIDATEGKDLLRKNFYIHTLENGAMAQELLYEDPGVLVTDLVFASINGASALYADKTTAEILPEYTGEVPSGKKFAGWNVAKYDADFAVTNIEAAAGDEITIDAHTVVSAVFEDIANRGFGQYFNDTDGDYNSALRWDMSNSNLSGNRSEWYNKTSNGSSSLSLIEDAGDTALLAERITNDENTIQLGYRNTNAYYNKLNSDGETENNLDENHIAVFEFDVKFDATSIEDLSNTEVWTLLLYTGGTNGRYIKMRLAVTSAGKIRVLDTSSPFQLDQNTWYNIRFEVDINGNYKTYVDNTLVKDFTYSSSDKGGQYNQTSAYDRMELAFNSAVTYTWSITIDNVFLGSYIKSE